MNEQELLGRKVHVPIDNLRRGFGVGIPTLGAVPFDFAASLQQALPINFGCIYLTQNGFRWDWEKNEPIPTGGDTKLPVADARNVIAWLALKNNLEWLFFRDDDTIAPNDACNRLFVLARECQKKGIPISCVGGNYMSKQFPPHSLILLDGYVGGYENWRVGDLVEVANEKRKGAIGMGMTLIPMSVIAKMEPPWFKTIKSLDPKSKHFDHMSGGEIHDGNDIADICPGQIGMTEDFYFCAKARRYGFSHVYCDTSLQGVHIDLGTGKKHFFHGGLNRGVVQSGSVIQWHSLPGDPVPLPGYDHPFCTDDPVKGGANWKRPEGPVRFDLGQPGKKEGYVTIDLFEPSADERADIHNLGGMVAKYGLADEIRASHILEHFAMSEIVGMLTEWAKALKPGTGIINIEVPDAEWGCENVLKHKDADPESYLNQLYKLIGLQSNPGDFHKMLFTKAVLKGFIEIVPQLELLECDFHVYPDPAVQRAIRARARRRASDVQLLPDGTIVGGSANGHATPAAPEAGAEAGNAVQEPANRVAALAGAAGVGAGAGAGSNGEGAAGNAGAPAAEAKP